MSNSSAKRLLLLSNVFNNFGQGVTMITIPMYFSSIAETNMFSVCYFLVTLVTLFWTPFAGMLVDKYKRQSIFILINLVCAICLGVFCIAGSVYSALMPYAAASAFAVIFWNYGIYYTCFYSFLQEILKPQEYGQIAKTIEIQAQFSSGIAAALAGFLFAGSCFEFTNWFNFGICFPKLSIATILGVNAGIFFITCFMISRMRYEKQTTQEKETGTISERLKTGLVWLLDNKPLMWFGIHSFGVFTIIIIGCFLLFPMYISNHLAVPASSFSIFELFYSTGAMTAGFLIQKLFGWTTNIKAIILLTFISVLMCFYLVFNDTVLVLYLVGFLLGITNAGIRVLRMSYLFTVLPNWVSGRVNSLFALSNVIVRLFFSAIFSIPFFHAGNHVIYAFMILAIYVFLSAIGMYLLRNRLVSETIQLSE